LNFNEGKFIKEIDLYGLGVDFNSPLITTKNSIAEYYRQLVDELGKPKYI
jgi:hypothetical protein